ncbi:HEAT repeat domain-containing protein [Luteitalea sp.]
MTHTLAFGLVLFLTQPLELRIPTVAAYEAMDDFTQEAVLLRLTTIPPSEMPASAFALLEAGVSDPTSAEARRRAVGILGQIALYEHSARLQSQAQARPLPALVAQRLREPLCRLLGDPDPKARELAMNLLVLLSVRPGADVGDQERIESWMLAAFATEQPNVKRQIVARLKLLGNSGDATTVLLGALDDADEAVMQQAALTIAERRPPGGAEALAKVLGRGTSGVRAAVADAIGAYGPDASHQLPRMQAALAKESDPFTRSALERAIERVRRP